MSKKPFPDHCLEISERATPGKWVVVEGNHVAFLGKSFFEVHSLCEKVVAPQRIELEDAEFIAASRTLLPECARRLKRAIENIRDASCHCRNLDLNGTASFLYNLADELEAPLEKEG